MRGMELLIQRFLLLDNEMLHPELVAKMRRGYFMDRCDYCRYKNSWDCEDGWDRVRNDKICDDFVLEFKFLSKKQQMQIQKILMQQD